MRFRGVAALVAAGLFGWTATTPAAQAQDILDAWVEFNWVDMTQQECLDRGLDAMERAIDEFGLDATTRVEEWNILGINDDLNMWVFCVADADGLVDPNADRLLIMTSVNTALPDISGVDLRNFLSDCVWATCPAGDGGKGEPPEGTMTWFDSALDYRGQDGTLLDFTCPALGDGDFGGIWGTEVYTDDSSICAAAVHTGVIGFDGGTVTIEILPGRKAYQGTTQNGLTSNEWGTYDGSFRVIIPVG